VYKENELLKKEVKSMYILLDENNDLREELERLRQMSYDDRVKESGEEN
jgi:cell shape-determining protein MreC